MKKSTSYLQIIKSTSIIGSSQIYTVILSIIRTKIIALILGPVGIGLIGILQSTIDLIKNFAGLGIPFSAVRRISEVESISYESNTNKIIFKILIITLITSLIGLLSTLLLSNLLSDLSFDSTEYSAKFRYLSLAVFFNIFGESYRSILQGQRKISDYAKANMISFTFGVITSIPLYLILGLKGIVPSIIINSVITVLTFVIVLDLGTFSVIEIKLREIGEEFASLFKFGFFLVLESTVVYGSLYLIRIIISKKLGIDSVGIFQAGWTLSANYIGLILIALGTDFYPRISSIFHDKSKISQLVNEQAEVSLFLAIPFLTGMLSFMPEILKNFYSVKFLPASALLRWLVIGTYIKLLAWPIRFVLLASARGLIFFLLELLWNVLFIGLILLFWERFKLESIGISYLISYVLYLSVLMIVTNGICKLNVSRKLEKLILVTFILMIISALNSYLNISYLRIILGISILTFSSYNAIKFYQRAHAFDIDTNLNLDA